MNTYIYYTTSFYKRFFQRYLSALYLHYTSQWIFERFGLSLLLAIYSVDIELSDISNAS